jgi:hypothetical protein
LIYIRNAEGSVQLARLDSRRVMAHWRKHWKDREVVTEWRLTLDDQPIALSGVLALHRWDEGNPIAIEGARRDDGKWQIDVPMAWHTTCVEVSGTLHIELDEEKLSASLREEFQVEL